MNQMNQMNQMNLTEFAHAVGLALGHAGAIHADPDLVRWAVERDALLEYVAATAVARITASSPADSPRAMAGFRPVVVDAQLAYGHVTNSGRLTVDLYPDDRAAELRFEAGGGRHIVTITLTFLDAARLMTDIEAGDLSLLDDGRADRLELLFRLDLQCGGLLRSALEAEVSGPLFYDAEYVAGVQRLLAALDMVGAEAAGV